MLGSPSLLQEMIRLSTRFAKEACCCLFVLHFFILANFFCLRSMPNESRPSSNEKFNIVKKVVGAAGQEFDRHSPLIFVVGHRDSGQDTLLRTIDNNFPVACKRAVFAIPDFFGKVYRSWINERVSST